MTVWWGSGGGRLPAEGHPHQVRHQPASQPAFSIHSMQSTADNKTEKAKTHVPIFVVFDFLELFEYTSLTSGSGAFRFDIVAPMLPSSEV